MTATFAVSVDVEDLRIRLEEAEEALRAIRCGEVDVLVVAGPDRDQIFSLHGAEHPYRLFVEQMSEGAVIISADGVILFHNRRFLEITGSGTTILGQELDSIPDVSIRALLSRFLTMRGQDVVPEELTSARDDRERTLKFVATWAELSSMVVVVTDVSEARNREKVLRNTNAEMERRIEERTAALEHTLIEVHDARLAALNMMADAVTAAGALERANRDLEVQIAARQESDLAHRRLATVVEQSAESIIIMDPAGVVEYVNPAFERITGYTSAETIGRTLRVLKSGKQDAAFYEHLWATLKSGADWHGHFVNHRKDGSLYEEDATFSPVRAEDGTIIHFVAIKRDVTAEVALGEQLRHAQKIEAIGTLAGGVAHDFNNLLQGMLSFVHLLKKHIDTPRESKYLTQLEQIVRRGAQLTRQLLLFARRETSKREDLDLNEIVRDLEVFLRRVVRENIELRIELAGVPLSIKGDRGQIEQVIMNLAVNAIDAMPEGGILSIAAGHEEKEAFLKVSDNGTGIPTAIRDRIFEPFFTTKENGKGTGLGLAVVHGIVAGHGGTMGVDCPESGGTTFRVAIPLCAEEVRVAAGATEEETLADGRGHRILLVEDEPVAREGLCQILDLMGYSVVVAASGEEALSLESQEPYSVVLTDFMLPGMSGTDVVHKLRERWPDLSAIVMSGYSAPGTVDVAVAAKEFLFLQKPFDANALNRTLRMAFKAPASSSPGGKE